MFHKQHSIVLELNSNGFAFKWMRTWCLKRNLDGTSFN